MIYLGIDPGVSGGMAAIIGSTAEATIVVTPMPDSDREILEWMSNICLGDIPTLACLEQVSGWMGGNRSSDGGEYAHGGAPGSAMFRFGEMYGAVKMALVSVGLVQGATFFLVTPRVWQQKVGIPPRGPKTKTQHKLEINAIAKARYPDIKGVTLKTCDALLLASYCKWVYG